MSIELPRVGSNHRRTGSNPAALPTELLGFTWVTVYAILLGKSILAHAFKKKTHEKNHQECFFHY